MRIFFAAWAAFLLLATVSMAEAQGPQCTFSASNISFGTVDLQKGNPYDAAGTFTYACTGDARQIVRICVSWGLAKDGSRWMSDSAGDKLVYNLYTDADRNTVWGTWYDKNTKGAQIDVPLGRSQKVTGSVPVYGRIAANQQGVPAGAYKAAIDRGNAAISYGDASKGSCDSFKHGDRVSVGLNVTASVHGAGSGPGAITAPDATNPHPESGPQASAGSPQQKQSLMQKLAANARYQQEQQNKAADANSANSSGSQSSQEDRAKYIESHSCMTTMGADKANELAEDCNKVTSGSHKGCNIQENTCDEIRSTTQKGCWGLAASAPDFCLSKYR